MASESRPLSLLAIWNMSFGFLGIQFGFGLQLSNMSAIYQYLGASESTIPLLWLAAPVTGLIVQPIIGHYSDRTWTRLGRRRPYFLAGAILASAALVAMPNCSSLWMAAGLLWILDGSVNVSMEPFRAFVGDLLPPSQRTLGYSMQSLLIGLGAVLSSGLPWLLTRLGLANEVAAPGVIPKSVRLSFYLGAVVFLGSVLVTIFTTSEKPPISGEEKPRAGGPSAFAEIMLGLRQMPLMMRRLAVVQFFTWLGLFCMWIYFVPAVAHGIFHGEAGSVAYQEGAEWGGLCFAVYNGVAFVAAFGLIHLAKRGVSPHRLYRWGLGCAGLGLLATGVWTNPGLLLVSMLGVGIGWATILSMPYALLASSLPPGRMGFYMGVFNFFIVIPQILAATVLGAVVEHLLGGRPILAVMAGGVALLLAAAAVSFVPPVPADSSGLVA